MKEKRKCLFNSGQKMYDFIESGGDLYSPSIETYVFVYNEEGSICVYTGIDSEYAKELDSGDEYWGAYLGWRGSAIYDTTEYKKRVELLGK